LFSNTTGLRNTGLGYFALYNNTSGSHNCALGQLALYDNVTGYDNTAIGTNALLRNTTGFQNTAIGRDALRDSYTGNYNNAHGQEALYDNNSGSWNNAFGNNALRFNRGNNNTAMGDWALYQNTTGNNNTALGSGADLSSINLSNATAIGANAKVNTSNTIKLGNNAIDSVITSGKLKLGAVTYPNTHGTNGQVLSTSGSGALNWANAPGVGGFTHYLGEAFNGGIIYYLYKGSDGLEHGLIVALTESTAAWQTSGSLVNANRTEDGAYNTNLMTNSPAKTYIQTLGAGWYLPSIDELGLLYYNRYSAQKGLRAGVNTLLSNLASYWSSNENTATNACIFSFSDGYQINNSKTNITALRGVRAF
jgi:hypothetical protein